MNTTQSMFTIGQVATMVGRSIKTIRRYEAAGYITPQRIGTYAHRMFTEADVVKLKLLANHHSERRSALLGWKTEAASEG